MHHPARGAQRERTPCASEPGGCAVGCPFCATGELGFTRDLETSEIVDQVRHAARRPPPTASGSRTSFMGMGEPLLNLDRVLAAVDASTTWIGSGSERGTSPSRPPGSCLIRRLTALGPQFTLPFRSTQPATRCGRARPLNRRWPIAEVVAAAGTMRPRPAAG
jgi:23S rRNA (adenine2503-C2)-methyltransferase